MILGIDPKVDYAFKHLLGRDSTRPILIDILDKILDPAPGHHIQEIELLNPFNPKEALDDKLSILDIKARDQAGRQFNVEMQIVDRGHYEKRILYYWARLHQQQLHEGKNYGTLKPTISISFLNYQLFPQAGSYHSRFRLLEDTHHFPFGADMAFHVLELPKFNKPLSDSTTGLDVWLYFLRHVEKMDTDRLPVAFQQPLVLRAVEELKMLTQTDLERERYEARRKAQMDYDSGLEWARAQGLTKGLALGAISKIHLCEQLLHRSETPVERLTALPLEELNRLADELQSLVLRQGQSDTQRN